MIAGTLSIEMNANLARLADDMNKAKGMVGGAMKDIESAVGTAKSVLAALGITLGVGYFVNFLKGTNDAIAHMKELGQEAGTSAEAISRFEEPSRKAGLGLDTVAAAIFKMNKASLDAKDPLSKSALALDAIGISTQQLKGLKPDEMFELVARSISKYGDGLAKNEIMQQLFGKSGREMNRVVADIAAQSKLTATVTDDQVEASKRLNDQIVELKMNSEKSWRSIVAEGVPALNDILKAFLDARKEGSLLDGVIAGLSMTFEKMAGNTPEKKLAEVNERIKNIQATTASWKTSGQLEEAARLNEYLMLRKALEQEIFDREMAAQVKRQQEAASGMPKKPTLEFDPKRAELTKRAAELTAQSIIDFNEQVAKGISELDQAETERIKGLLALSQKYQDIASAAVAAQAQQGEILANSLGTDADIENKAYAEKLAALNAYFATKEDFTVQDQARLERLTLEHEAKLGNLFAQGALDRMKFDAMTWDMQAKTVTSSIVGITQAAASGNKRMFELNKLAAEADIIVSTSQGVMKAWGQGGWFGGGMALLIGAAGAANLQRVHATSFGGGGGVASSVSGSAGGALPVLPVAGSTSGSQQTQPSGPQFQIFINGNIIGQEEYVRGTLIPIIVGDVAGRDLRLVPPQSRNAQDIRDGAP